MAGRVGADAHGQAAEAAGVRIGRAIGDEDGLTCEGCGEVVESLIGVPVEGNPTTVWLCDDCIEAMDDDE